MGGLPGQRGDRVHRLGWGSFTFAGLHVADALGVPYVGVSLWPDTPTWAFPAVFLADRVGDLGPLNRASHVAVERLFWQPFRTQINSWRTRRLGLPALPTTGPYQRLRRDRVLQLCGYSPAVVPVPRDWPAEHPVTATGSSTDQPAGRPRPSWPRSSPPARRCTSGSAA